MRDKEKEPIESSACQNEAEISPDRMNIGTIFCPEIPFLCLSVYFACDIYRQGADTQNMIFFIESFIGFLLFASQRQQTDIDMDAIEEVTIAEYVKGGNDEEIHKIDLL